MEYTSEETAVFVRVISIMAIADNEIEIRETKYFYEVMEELEVSLYEKDLAGILSNEQVEQILKQMSKEMKIKLGQTAWKMMHVDGKMRVKEEDYYIYLLNTMGLL